VVVRSKDEVSNLLASANLTNNAEKPQRPECVVLVIHECVENDNVYFFFKNSIVKTLLVKELRTEKTLQSIVHRFSITF
jgi:hypothetical protein